MRERERDEYRLIETHGGPDEHAMDASHMPERAKKRVCVCVYSFVCVNMHVRGSRVDALHLEAECRPSHSPTNLQQERAKMETGACVCRLLCICSVSSRYGFVGEAKNEPQIKNIGRETIREFNRKTRI